MSTVKISANLPEETFSTLQELAEKRGVTMTEVLRQAISLDKFLQDEIDMGSKVMLEREGDLTQVVMFR